MQCYFCKDFSSERWSGDIILLNKKWYILCVAVQWVSCGACRINGRFCNLLDICESEATIIVCLWLLFRINNRVTVLWYSSRRYPLSIVAIWAILLIFALAGITPGLFWWLKRLTPIMSLPKTEEVSFLDRKVHIGTVIWIALQFSWHIRIILTQCTLNEDYLRRSRGPSMFCVEVNTREDFAK